MQSKDNRKYFHSKELHQLWKDFHFLEQMANIGSEVYRAINWRQRGDEKAANAAFYRSLELIDFTLECKLSSGKLKELCRIRECWVDFFMYENTYNFTAEFWLDYFNQLTYANAMRKGK